MKTIFLTTCMFMFCSPLCAQTAKISMADGTSICGQIKEKIISVNTKYGVLKIPIADIYNVTFGLHYETGQKEAIADAVKKLESPAYKVRDEASKFLINTGQHSIPFLRKVNDNEEAKKRAEAIEKTIVLKAPYVLNGHDTIYTKYEEIRGYVDAEEFEVTCFHKELGVLKPKVVNIRDIIVNSDKQKTVLTIKDGWVKTDFYVSKGSAFRVEASGLTDLFPDGNAQYMATPNGRANLFGKLGSRFLAGALIGKVGDGEEFLIGERFYSSSVTSGILQLQIVDNPWGNENSGSYMVTINGRR